MCILQLYNFVKNSVTKTFALFIRPSIINIYLQKYAKLVRVGELTSSYIVPMCTIRVYLIS